MHDLDWWTPKRRASAQGPPEQSVSSRATLRVRSPGWLLLLGNLPIGHAATRQLSGNPVFESAGATCRPAL